VGALVAHRRLARDARCPREHWDPLGLAGVAPDDECDSYASVLASKLRRGNDRSDIVAYLTTVLVNEKDEDTSTWTARCEQAADALMAWYAQSNAPL
jgi:hypothetical protein